MSQHLPPTDAGFLCVFPALPTGLPERAEARPPSVGGFPFRPMTRLLTVRWNMDYTRATLYLWDIEARVIVQEFRNVLREKIQQTLKNYRVTHPEITIVSVNEGLLSVHD